MDPTEEVISEKELAEYDRRCKARAQASADPTPGPLANAFEAAPVRVAQLILQPVLPSHLLLLKRLNTASYRAAMESLKAEEDRAALVPGDGEEVFEEIYLFTRPIQEVREVLNKGREHYRETALRATADKLPLALFASVSDAVAAHLVAAFSTVLGHRPPAKDGESFPKPAGVQQTASAGGSGSSALSPASLAPLPNGSQTNGH